MRLNKRKTKIFRRIDAGVLTAAMVLTGGGFDQIGSEGQSKRMEAI